MVVTNDDKIAEKARLLKDLAHTRKKRFFHEFVGFNYRMTNIQAAMGCAQLENLEINNCRSLKNLPENIGNLKSLKSLIITGNTSLEKLPISLFNLNVLKTLNLYNNSIKELPDLIGNFSLLEILNLSNNQLIYMPYSVYKLSNLIDFTIDNNPPITVDDYDNLWHSSDFQIILNATDAGSGVSDTYYRINGGPIKSVSIDGQPLITIEGASNTLEYWSVEVRSLSLWNHL